MEPHFIWIKKKKFWSSWYLWQRREQRRKSKHTQNHFKPSSSKKRKNKKIKNLSPPALISFEQDVIPHDLTVLDSIIYHRFKGSTVEEIEIAIAIGQFIIEVAIVFIDCTSSIRNREGISTWLLFVDNYRHLDYVLRLLRVKNHHMGDQSSLWPLQK